MKKLLTSRSAVFILLIASFLLLELPLLTRLTRVWIDEPWYASTSYSFAQGDGLIETATGDGAGEVLFLYTLLLGTFFKGFGTSIFTARLFSVIAGLLSLTGFLLILERFRINLGIVLLAGMLFVFSNVNYIIFRTARPEAWVITFIVWGLYFMLIGMRDSKPYGYLVSGLLVSSSFLCHPNGGIYVLLFGIVVFAFSVKQKDILPAGYYVVGCFIVFAVLFVHAEYVRGDNLVSYFSVRAMERTSLGANGASNFFSSAWRKFLTFCKQYSLGIKRLWILTFELGILVYGLFMYRRDKFIFGMAMIGLGSFTMVVLFLSRFATREFGTILVFSLIVFGLLLEEMRLTGKRVKMRFVVALTLVYLLNNVAGDLYIIKRDYRKTSYSHVEEEIDETVPDGETVVTLLTFWFPVKNNESYNAYTRWHKKRYDNLDDLLGSGVVGYVVISDYLTRGRTATSGRQEASRTLDRHKLYYRTVHKFAVENGILVSTINTDGYGNIEIWKIGENNGGDRTRIWVGSG